MEEPRLTIVEHLQELRRRLIFCIVAVGVGFVIAYLFSKPLFKLLMLPLFKAMPEEAKRLYFTGLIEPFITYLKVGLIGGIFIASPVILHEVWRFIAPGLYRKEKGAILPFVIFGSVFFMGGAAFGYFVAFPYGFRFLMTYVTPDIQPMLTVREYLSLTLQLLLAFGLIFESPLLIFCLSRAGIVSLSGLRRFRKYNLILSFVIGAILSPPDVLSQCLMSVPLVILYEVGILLVVLFGKKGEKVSGDRAMGGPQQEQH